MNRLLVLSGVAFVALLAVSVIGVGGGTPAGDASTAKLVSFYSDNALRQEIGSFLLAAAAPFVVFFCIGLAHASGRPSAWSYVLFAGSALVAGSILVTAFIHFALTDSADSDISTTVPQALNALDANTWVMFNPALGVMMLGAAGCFLAGSVNRALGWIALVLGVALFVPYADFVALLATLVWILATGGLLARRRPAGRLVAQGAV